MSVDRSLCTKLHMHLAGLHTYTHRNGDKDTKTDKSRQTDTCLHRHTYVHRHLVRQTDVNTHAQTHKLTHTHTHTHTDTLQWATGSDATSSTTNI